MTKYFLLRGTTEIKTIYLRLRDGRQSDFMISIGLKIESKKWDDKRSMPKNNIVDPQIKNLITKLNEISKSIDDYELGPGLHADKNKEWLKKAITYNRIDSEIESTFVNLIKEHIEILTHKNDGVKTGLSKQTLNQYRTTIGRLEKYEIQLNKKIYPKDLSFDFYDNYIKFSKEYLKLAVNSIGNDIKNIKAVCNEAKERRIDINQNVFSKKFKKISETVDFITLTVPEINRIFNYKYSKELELARDWLIIGLWTACRVGDLLSLNSKNLIYEKGIKIIKYKQTKTGKIIRLGIHPQVEHILKQRNNNFPETITSPEFNLDIKLICKAVDINEPKNGKLHDYELGEKRQGIYPKYMLASSHIARRSFATNHYGNLPTSKIMRATGHSTEKMLLCYIGEDEEDHVEDFIEFWKNK